VTQPTLELDTLGKQGGSVTLWDSLLAYIQPPGKYDMLCKEAKGFTAAKYRAGIRCC